MLYTTVLGGFVVQLRPEIVVVVAARVIVVLLPIIIVPVPDNNPVIVRDGMLFVIAPGDVIVTGPLKVNDAIVPPIDFDAPVNE